MIQYHNGTVGSRNIKPFFTPISRRVKGLSEEEVKKIEGVELELIWIEL